MSIHIADTNNEYLRATPAGSLPGSRGSQYSQRGTTHDSFDSRSSGRGPGRCGSAGPHRLWRLRRQRRRRVGRWHGRRLLRRPDHRHAPPADGFAGLPRPARDRGRRARHQGDQRGRRRAGQGRRPGGRRLVRRRPRRGRHAVGDRPALQEGPGHHRCGVLVGHAERGGRHHGSEGRPDLARQHGHEAVRLLAVLLPHRPAGHGPGRGARQPDHG